MTFKEMPFNTTQQVKGGNRITGSKNAIFVRNRYQTTLDNDYASFVNMIHHIEDNERWKAVDYSHRLKGLEQDIESHKSERVSLYTNLRDTLNKELDFQKWMRGKTEKMASTTTENIKTNIQKVSDSSEINIDAITDFLKVNPEHASTPNLITLTSSIKDKEREIREKEEAYNEIVMLFNREIQYLISDLDKCNKMLVAYHSHLKEWYDKIERCRYYKSILFHILPENRKVELLPDTINHRIDQFTSTLTLFNNELIVFKTLKFA